MADLLNQLASSIAETVEQMVTARIRAWMTSFVRSEIKVIYSETEAAKFLGVSKDTLQAWRRRGLLSFAQYPQAKADELGDIYTYDIAGLLSFRERYLHHVEANNVYEISPIVTLSGPEIKRAA